MTLVFDNTPLSHFARAGRVGELEQLSKDHRRVTTQAVHDELARAVHSYPAIATVLDASWLEVVSGGSLAELHAFAEYARRLGAGDRNIGEASVLAWAEVNAAIAIVDERAGWNHGRERGVEVHGTLWLIAEGYLAGELDESSAESLVDALRDTEAWFPCSGTTYFEWARMEGLLP